jgi:DHA1 family multidrug resistance protein-like MFS transporter
LTPAILEDQTSGGGTELEGAVAALLLRSRAVRVSGSRRLSFGPLEQWQRNQYAVVASVALAFFAIELSNPFIPLYIRQLGVTDVNDAAFWAGLVSGITPMLAALMGPVWGVVADKYGRKSMVVRALVCIGICQFCTAFVPNVYWLLGLRTVMGMFAGFTSMSMALAISVSPRERMPQTISLVQAAQIAPSAIGPLIGGPLADLLGQRTSFMVTGVLLLIPIALVSIVLKETPPVQASTTRTTAKQNSGSRSLLSLMMLPGFGIAIAILFLTRFGERAIQPIIPLYLIELQTPSAQLATITGVAVAGGAIAATCSSLLYGRWAHPGTIRRVLMLALSGAAVAGGLFALARGWPEVVGLRLLIGLLAGGTISLAYTMGARLAPADRSATTMSLLASWGMLGTATAPILSGIIAQNISLRAVFAMTAAAYVVAASLVAIPALREARSQRRAHVASAAEAESG